MPQRPYPAGAWLKAIEHASNVQNRVEIIETAGIPAADFVTVRNYGALGDGVADDLPAFEAALAEHDMVWVPQPSVYYRIGGTLVVPDGKGLVGIGGHFRRTAIRAADKTQPAIRLEGHVRFGDLSVGFEESLTSADTAAVALELSSTRRSWIGPVDVLNAGYGIRMRQGQGALDPAGVNASFQMTWSHLDLRQCHVTAIDLHAVGTANTANVFNNVRVSNFATGTSRLSVPSAIELGANTDVVFGALNIEHSIFMSSVIRVTSGEMVQIGALHMEGLDIENSSASVPILSLGANVHCRVGAWKLWNNPTNPTRVRANTIAYLCRLRADARLEVGQLISKGVIRDAGADLRLSSYPEMTSSSAWARFGSATLTGITTHLDEDASGAMPDLVRITTIHGLDSRVEALEAGGGGGGGGGGSVPLSSLWADTVTQAIANSLDDAEEDLATGAVIATGNILELGAGQMVGVRFANLPIPQGATITRASIQFAASGADSGPCTLDIRAEAGPSAVISETTGNLTSRPKTSAVVSWVVPDWPTAGEAGPAQETPDLSALVREAVGSASWTSGSALTIVLSGTGGRRAHSWDGNAQLAPVLRMAYAG